jgi:hypothetical protein
MYIWNSLLSTVLKQVTKNLKKKNSDNKKNIPILPYLLPYKIQFS